WDRAVPRPHRAALRWRRRAPRHACRSSWPAHARPASRSGRCAAYRMGRSLRGEDPGNATAIPAGEGGNIALEIHHQLGRVDSPARIDDLHIAGEAQQLIGRGEDSTIAGGVLLGRFEPYRTSGLETL